MNDCDTLNACLLALWNDRAPTVTSGCDAGLAVFADYPYPVPDPITPGDPCPPSHPCPPSDPKNPKNASSCTTLNNILKILQNPLAGKFMNSAQCAAILNGIVSALAGLASPILPLPI
jgi:hypothetical protein